jgi:beta-glucanase (GH16 family)
MRNRLLFFGFILLVNLAALCMLYETIIANSYSYKTIVFEDTFTGKQLDAQKWNTTLKVFGRMSDSYHNRSYANTINSNNVRVDNKLILTTTKSKENEYASGMVSSHEKFVFRYGYIEVFAKYPAGNGVWPAFWLMPQDQTWPPEIDVAEYYGGSKVMHTGLCYGDFPTVKWDSDGYSDPGIETTYSTYGLYWSPTMLVWYFNGEVKKVIKGNYIPNKPMYIILSNGVSTEIGPSGVPDAHTTFPNSLDVKYVKVYR